MSAQPSSGHEPVVDQIAHQPSKPVGLGFIAVYAGAYFALWMALLTPVIVTLAIRVQQIDPAGKAGSLSLVLGVGAFFALVSNPFFGKLSDRTASRFGMRRPWIVAGAIASTLGLLIIALAQSITGVLIGWCLSQTAFNALLAVVVAVLPDQVPEEQRGRVSGVLGMCQSAAQVAGTFIAQQLAYSSFWMFMLPAAINLVACLVLAVTLRDRTIDRSQVPPYSFGEFLRSFWVNPIKHSDFGWAWAGRFLLFMGLATLISYQVFYLTDHLGRDPESVPQLIFTSTLVLSACVVVSSYAGGWLSDRFRRRKDLRAGVGSHLLGRAVLRGDCRVVHGLPVGHHDRRDRPGHLLRRRSRPRQRGAAGRRPRSREGHGRLQHRQRPAAVDCAGHRADLPCLRQRQQLHGALHGGGHLHAPGRALRAAHQGRPLRGGTAMIDLRARPFHLTEEDVLWVDRTLAGMDLDAKIGQLFCLLGMVPEEGAVQETLGKLKPGGMMFRPAPGAAVQQIHRFLQENSDIPMLVAANLERGGNGIATDGTNFASPLQVAATDDEAQAYRLGVICGREGSAVGCNWTFSP